jgi:site-specific recombinase XerD
LLPSATIILDKYADNPYCITNDKALPVATNQKMNEYLREIATLCGINKELSMHIARHTFATTVTLLNGVPIESVSKMLGHTNIRTTQIYAKVLDIKVGEDMAALRQKYAGV